MVGPGPAEGKPTTGLAQHWLDGTTGAVSEVETDPLGQPVAELPGIGGERAARLAKLGIRTVGDLLWHGPRRYEDRNQPNEAKGLAKGDTGTVAGPIVVAGVKRMRRGKSLFEFILDDGTARLHCRWWNMPYMERYYKTGDFVHVHGKLTSEKPRTMDHPEAEVAEEGEEFIHLKRIVPVYRLTDGIKQRWLRGVMWRVVEQFAAAVPNANAELLAGDDSHWLPLAEAFKAVHFPGDLGQTELARERLALEEFIRFQRQIRERRKTFQAKVKALECSGDDRLVKPFLAGLGFEFTGAQQRAWDEIARDMAGSYPMRRLLQGDVGSGKTAVAACAGLRAVESGFSVVVLAPTEILAEQHYRVFGKWLEPFGIPVHLHTGARKTMSDPGQAELSMGNNELPPLVIGTHALVEEKFALENIGLAIIDEQHKFGVEQRKKLVRKGQYPHVLVMTATPIPRTAAMTVYGDLDVSVIDEMPPGRIPIRTDWLVDDEDDGASVWSIVRDEVAAGHQAYVVCPLIEESEALEVRSAEETHGALTGGVLSDLRVGLLHGRVGPAEKEETMRLFRSGALDVLVATTVIEVGVDVPNATVMVVLDASRFGIAQLHQLRGRVGRGADESRCLLVGEAVTPDSEERLKALVRTTDGFELAEVDLDLRGEGTIMGERQKGRNDLRLASLRRDREWVEVARDVAIELVGDGDGLDGHPALADEMALLLGGDEVDYLLKS